MVRYCRAPTVLRNSDGSNREGDVEKRLRFPPVVAIGVATGFAPSICVFNKGGANGEVEECSLEGAGRGLVGSRSDMSNGLLDRLGRKNRGGNRKEKKNRERKKGDKKTRGGANISVAASLTNL
ncbi:hypothetical protein MRB53_019148 [Persea americana]|uniref:Uncharacterized protein n=1 Tax=Persea americana TaxID=3435 RepID=A0ACC2MA20_PERAE|nr:hypothetical protein MRB53_019148 [Persea americana]